MEGTSTSNAVQINHYSFIAMQQFFLANPELIEKSYLYFNNDRNTLCVCIGATIGDKNEPTVIIIDFDSDSSITLYRTVINVDDKLESSRFGVVASISEVTKLFDKYKIKFNT